MSRHIFTHPYSYIFRHVITHTLIEDLPYDIDYGTDDDDFSTDNNNTGSIHQSELDDLLDDQSTLEEASIDNTVDGESG